MPLTNIMADSNADCVSSNTIKLKGRDIACPAIAEIIVPMVIRLKSFDHTFFRIILITVSSGVILLKGTELRVRELTLYYHAADRNAAAGRI